MLIHASDTEFVLYPVRDLFSGFHDNIPRAPSRVVTLESICIVVLVTDFVLVLSVTVFGVQVPASSWPDNEQYGSSTGP